MQKSQNGFVLISVLLITTISTVYAFSEIKGNQLQERIGGNQQKEMNARLMAEKGVFDSLVYVKTAYTNGDTPDVIAGNLNAQFLLNDEINITNPASSLTDISFTSQGSVDGAKAFLQAKIKIVKGVPDPGWTKAITGCDGVTLKGSGLINSFDSTLGDYDTDYIDDNNDTLRNINNNGDTETLYADAKIHLEGDSPIYGNVNATGDFEMSGSSAVMGNISSNSNVLFNSKNASSSHATMVSGDVYSGGDVDINDNTVGGTVTGKNNVKDTENVAGEVKAGTISGSHNNNNSTVAGDYNGPGVAVGTASDCDKRGITQERSTYSAQVGKTTEKLVSGIAVTNQDFDYSHDSTKNRIWDGETLDENNQAVYTETGISFNFTPDKAQYYDHSSGTMALNDSVSVNEFLGKTEANVHVFNNFTLNSQDITISGGAVRFLVKGDFVTEGYASKIKVEKGSTLTLIVNGKVTTIDGTEIIEVDDPNDPSATSVNGESPVNIYSGYESTSETDLALNLQGTDFSASIEAPLGHVAIKAAGSFKGAIRGKTVLVDGAGGVHFDENLLEGSTGGNPIPPSFSYASVYYHYE